MLFRSTIVILSFFLVNCVLHPEEFPNLLAGTFTDGNKFSTGNTLPLVGRPWGFNHWAPQTKEAGRFSGSWWFSGNDHTLTWIRCTHQPSPWIGDWGYFFLTPQMGSIHRSPIHEWQSRGALLKPYLLDISLAPKNIRIELTPTDHAAVIRVTFPASSQLGAKHVCLANLAWSEHGNDNTNHLKYITGRATAVNSDRMFVSNFALYVKAISIEANEIVAQEDLMCFHYPVEATSVVIRIATSLISMNQVDTNMEREVPLSKSFDDTLLETKNVWNRIMSRVNILDAGQLTEQSARYMQIFYTGLYRALMFPRRIDEIDSKGQLVHYSPYDPHGGIHPGPLVTDNGLWDTYRTVYPLLSLIYPDQLGIIIQGWLNAFKEGGWLPSWASPGYRNCMVGTFADVIISDAIVKDISGFDLQMAINALRKDSFEVPPRYVGGAVGKEGLQEYIDQGFISFDRGGEVVSRTLDYGFADYSVSQAFLKLLQDEHRNSIDESSRDGILEDAKKLFQRSVRAYSSLWNREKQLMVPKSRSGSFLSHLSPIEWGNGFTEGNSWQHSFPAYAFECSDTLSVYKSYLAKNSLVDSFDCHNGLVSYFPQKEDGVYLKLKALFDSTSDFGFGSYGQEIHEMTEGRALAMGQYFHNNQPVHHILYLFSVLGNKYYRHTQRLVRTVLNRAYGIDFYAGDEDNGEQGAWFVLSALGLFSLTPGTPSYVAGSPIFRHVRISRSNGGNEYTNIEDIKETYLDLFAFHPLKEEKDSLPKSTIDVDSKEYYVEKVQLIPDNGDGVVITDNHKVDNKYLKNGGIARFILESETVDMSDWKNKETLMTKIHKTSTHELELYYNGPMSQQLKSEENVIVSDTQEGKKGKDDEIKYLHQEVQELTVKLKHMLSEAGNISEPTPTLFQYLFGRFFEVCLVVGLLITIACLCFDRYLFEGSNVEDRKIAFPYFRGFSVISRYFTVCFRNSFRTSDTPSSAKRDIDPHESSFDSTAFQHEFSHNAGNNSYKISKRQSYTV